MHCLYKITSEILQPTMLLGVLTWINFINLLSYKKRNLTASFYFQANTLQTKQKVKDYNTSLICIYHILICEASISNITPSDYEVCDGKHTFTTNQIFVTRVKSMQHTITHSKQDKNIEFYINLCKKNSHLQPKKLPSY